jgi:cobyrinic acid a,c-diamide synthase
MGLILAGDRSGTGKTTLTLALLAALKKRDRTVQSFKVGSDYIDPMFHSTVTGRPCYSLDPVLTSEDYVQSSYQKHSVGTDCAVIEGVMGLFDGASGTDDTASTAHVARLLNLPVLLVVDCARMSRSLAALVKGYQGFDERINIVGVVLNRVGSNRHLELLCDALAAIDMPILGVFRREPDIHLPDRHLGLVPTAEVSEFAQIADRLATLGSSCFDWPKLEPWLAAEKTEQTVRQDVMPVKRGVRIAIAQDPAFSFYYPDNLKTLEEQGAELLYWSPLKDSQLPSADGLYFGGGFPEVFAAELSANKSMTAAVRQAIEQGLPTYAECGGLMYLSEAIIDFEGKRWPMVGVLPQIVRMGEKLSLGYRQAVALSDGPLLKQGQLIVGHEFHRSSVIDSAVDKQPVYEAQRYWGQTKLRGVEGDRCYNLHASYIHLHWGHRPEIAQRFVQTCLSSQYFAKPLSPGHT